MKKSAIILLHLGYWISYLFVILVLVLFMQGRFIFQGLSLFVFLLAFAFIPAVMGFYLFYTFLFTRFLKRKKIAALVITAIITAAGCGCFGWLLLHFVWNVIGPANKAPLDKGGYNEIISMMILVSINALLNGVIALVMRGFISWYADIKLKEALNKKNYEMELALVKSQINPHFLFNTINNIDVLIEKDSVKASAYLNKLSDILRFMLYETKTEKVPLAKELSYIGKYIDLQKIRSASLNYINYLVEGCAGNKMIEPMLFIPFIENAFKHAENKKEENAIAVKIDIEKEIIRFSCQNKCSKILSINAAHHGLGNQLIRKRLELLYPGRHSLTIGNENGIYSVLLILQVNEN